MTNVAATPTGNGKWWAGFVAAFAATYAVDHLEKNYGFNFKEAGTDPAIVKGLLEGSCCSFFVWLTPDHIVQSITDMILFVKNAYHQWRDAINKPN